MKQFTIHFTMKRRIIIISVFSFLFAHSFLAAQTIDEIYHFANQQFKHEKYQEALVELQRVAYFDYDQQYNDVYEKIGDSFFAIGKYEMAVQNFNIAFRITQDDSLKSELIFKKVNCFFQQNNFLLALNELLGISEPNTAYLRNKYHLFLATSYFGIGQYDLSLANFEELLPIHLRLDLAAIFSDFEKFRKRFRPNKIQTMSMLMPGLGQIYLGKIGQGINSVFLVGGIAVATVFIWQSYGLLDAFLSSGSWYYRYYTGGYRNAKNLAVHKLDHEKDEVFQSILNLVEKNIYPLP